MLELVLGSFAGLATAAAVKKFPKNKQHLVSMGTSSHIRTQINSLKTEKDILTKTISRLYQHEVGLSPIQRDKLLLRYQHQLGMVLAKIEKLEEASKHPDLGPVGDGLITLMDQKLSQLDQRLYELSSKIAVANVQVPEVKKEKEKIEVPEVTKENPKPVEKIVEEPKAEPPKPNIPLQNIEIDEKPQRPFELVTLTSLPTKTMEFPLIERKPVETKTEIIKEIEKPKPKLQVIETSLGSAKLIQPQIQQTKQEEPQTQLPEYLPKPEPIKEIEKPKPSVNLPEEDSDDDDSDDLDKIKGEIMKTLSKLEEAEVE